MATPREHIEQLRRRTFSIGDDEENPLAAMLDQAVKYLSAELYAKDVHFLMELIQNAEDNEYSEEVDPSLEFVITSRDITGTGAPATLLVFNNEKGFSAKNIESICSVGNSTKKGKRKRGYIGEKGIGFKSVFLITSRPHIFSNGYKIRFHEKPRLPCKLGYIVPEWVDDDKPSVADIQQVYGSSRLPTTTLVLPLKPDKVKPVKEQLSGVHPEVLLFLSKIKHLSVREENENPKLNVVSAIAITKEVDYVSRKNIDAESYSLHLSAESKGDGDDGQCSYYVWKQRFPVKRENIVEQRMDVEEWLVTLAFPYGERLHKGGHSPGVYAFLPTEMVTNFPFIIQADFILSSSREAVLLDNRWNQGILECVPAAFVNALAALVKTSEDAPVSSLPPMFRFLPVETSTYPFLNVVRESIQLKLAEESIVPSESYKEQKYFHKPREVSRLLPAFWDILKAARQENVNLHNLSSHGCYILASSFDRSKYDKVLKFLGVGFVVDEWYTKCIQSSNLVKGISDDLYIELLHFIAANWSTNLKNTNLRGVPLLRHVGANGNMGICSINESAEKKSGRLLCLSGESSYASMLIDWNNEFWHITPVFFLPEAIQDALRSSERRRSVLEWLKTVAGLVELNPCEYSNSLRDHLGTDQKLVVAYAHLLYRSHNAEFLTDQEVDNLCEDMPLVDSYGNVINASDHFILVPGAESRWLELIGSNPWRGEGYIELGEEYLQKACFCGQTSGGESFLEFLEYHVGASDIPDLSPPNAGIPTVSGPLTKKNAILLLDWINSLITNRITIPEKFLTCISNGSWLKVTMNGSSSYKAPSQSFLLSPKKKNSKWGSILQDGSVVVDIPLVDLNFYGEIINDYEVALKEIGVMFEYDEACEYIGQCLMSHVNSSTSTRSTVFSMLKFLRFLREKFLAPDQFISSIKGGKWLQTTSHGYHSPEECVLRKGQWAVAEQISELYFINDAYYGPEINSFEDELKCLGVRACLTGSHDLIVQHLKSSACLSGDLTKEALFLIFECMRNSKAAASKVVGTIQQARCLKTNVGYRSPGECFLCDPEWGSLLEVFYGSSPILDRNFYGDEIIDFKSELKQLGVKVDFEDATKAFVSTFKQQASLSKITKTHVLSFLACYRRLKVLKRPLSDIKTCILSQRWLWTRLGVYRSPRECILFGPEWKPLLAITRLPFLDDSYSSNGYGKDVVDEYARELKLLGVVVSLKDGAKFVPFCLYFPEDPSTIAPSSVLSLLQCIRILLEQKDYSFPESFIGKVSSEWLRTCVGYRAPKDCCLFDSYWEMMGLKPIDGPFIDESFFGPKLLSYKEELRKIGVRTKPEEVCKILARQLGENLESTSIVRIYNFLGQQKWKPENDESKQRIWFPDECGRSGKWVNPEECVLRDRDDLFGSQLYVLEKHYKFKLLDFFKEAFGVKSNPSLTDYCELWKTWERSGRSLTPSKCCSFWSFIVMNSHQVDKEKQILAGEMSRLPVVSGEQIVLADKHDVFIADDLQLKELFSEYSSIFAWYPQPSSPFLPRTKLMEVFRGIGVRAISESVQKEEENSTAANKCKHLNHLTWKNLAKIILGFLAHPSLDMEAKARHDKVKILLNLTVLETVEPLAVTYSLTLSSGEVISVKATQMIRWDKDEGKLYTQRLEKGSRGSRSGRNLLEYACRFSEVIAKGVLWDQKEEQITALSAIIKLAVLVKFEGAAVDFLMKVNNLQIFMEDEEFLASAFPSST
ncbi:unnamed protein product [Linum tenue]|uniref:Sacsin/Nov domain-containing protein n=1 Tax=Linum tenue TaxID=586396 RepID=A0AAV0N595_9ROSI|nr:unnamed protein product [Linum tenue]